MNSQILLLGGNQNDVITACEKAIQLLSSHLGVPVRYSAYYESEPWGFEAPQNFINQVVEFSSSIEPLELLNLTQAIEKELGRQIKTGTHYESRPIDIDVLFINDQLIHLPHLTVPHPKLHERMFTLLPLSEHWADLLHPLLKKTIQQLTLECKDEGIVKRL